MSETPHPPSDSASAGPAPEVPRTFFGFLRAWGPGIVVVLTWLGAGDVVSVGVAGGNYAYALMWAVAVATLMRFFFVSLIGKYELLNERGEGLLDGLARLHPLYAPVLLVAALVMGHAYGAYMTVGLGEICRNLVGHGPVWLWAALCVGLAFAILGRSVYARAERTFKVFLAILTVSFLGCALWVGPNVPALIEGTLAFRLPPQKGVYGSLLIAVGMIGAVGGSLMNLVYPYFLREKGWIGARYRRLQVYDLLLSIAVMIVLNLAVWTLGAELLHPRGLTITGLDDLPRLLSEVLGDGGRVLFYLGIFAAVFTSLVGHALGLASLGTHAWLRWRAGDGAIDRTFTRHPLHRGIVVWILLSPMVWTLEGMPGFIQITLIVQSGQVLLIPLLAGGIWWITARAAFIGAGRTNRWWENVVLLFLFVLALWGAWNAVDAVWQAARG